MEMSRQCLELDLRHFHSDARKFALLYIDPLLDKTVQEVINKMCRWFTIAAGPGEASNRVALFHNNYFLHPSLPSAPLLSLSGNIVARPVNVRKVLDESLQVVKQHIEVLDEPLDDGLSYSTTQTDVEKEIVNDGSGQPLPLVDQDFKRQTQPLNDESYEDDTDSCSEDSDDRRLISPPEAAVHGISAVESVEQNNGLDDSIADHQSNSIRRSESSNKDMTETLSTKRRLRRRRKHQKAAKRERKQALEAAKTKLLASVSSLNGDHQHCIIQDEEKAVKEGPPLKIRILGVNKLQRKEKCAIVPFEGRRIIFKEEKTNTAERDVSEKVAQSLNSVVTADSVCHNKENAAPVTSLSFNDRDKILNMQRKMNETDALLGQTPAQGLTDFSNLRSLQQSAVDSVWTHDQSTDDEQSYDNSGTHNRDPECGRISRIKQNVKNNIHQKTEDKFTRYPYHIRPPVIPPSPAAEVKDGFSGLVAAMELHTTIDCEMPACIGDEHCELTGAEHTTVTGGQLTTHSVAGHHSHYPPNGHTDLSGSPFVAHSIDSFAPVSYNNNCLNVASSVTVNSLHSHEETNSQSTRAELVVNKQSQNTGTAISNSTEPEPAAVENSLVVGSNLPTAGVNKQTGEVDKPTAVINTVATGSSNKIEDRTADTLHPQQAITNSSNRGKGKQFSGRRGSSLGTILALLRAQSTGESQPPHQTERCVARDATSPLNTSSLNQNNSNAHELSEDTGSHCGSIGDHSQALENNGNLSCDQRLRQTRRVRNRGSKRTPVAQQAAPGSSHATEEARGEGETACSDTNSSAAWLSSSIGGQPLGSHPGEGRTETT